jgi:hypothetical protein
MSGAFYGSLAASASVFVAILTALLVNNYVQIKSDRRQVKNELDRIEEDLKGLKERRDDYQDTVDALVEKREADYREKAKKQVNEFIDSEVPSEFAKPIEQLTVDELYQDLIDFHDYDSAEELEDSPKNFHHRELLEEQIDDIEDEILNEVVPPFASKYEGDGWDLESDPDHTSLSEKLAEIKDEEDGDNEEEDADEDDEEDNEDDSQTEEDDPDLVVEADFDRDVLELDEFIEKYKDKYGLDSLDDKTRELLEEQYDKVVDKNPYPNSSPASTLSNTLNTNPYSSLQPGFMDAALAASETGAFDDPMTGFDFSSTNTILGLSVQEQQKLEKARENLQDKENEIEVLEQRQGRLKREKERLHPEDLIPTLVANVATIVLSVVIPITTYLILVTNSQVTVPSYLWIISHTEVNVFLSWLLGLCVVFESIHARINDREPKAYSLYKRVKNRVQELT